MTTPLTFERRIEQLERRCFDLEQINLAQDRLPQGRAKRWNYWAKTVEPSGEETYPGDGGNTFPITSVDLEYTRAIGTQTLDLHLRQAADYQSIGRTANGQWVAPGELVMASPIPPPPNTVAKGRWILTPLKTYYYGFLQGTLNRLSSTTSTVFKQTPAGTWTQIGSFELTVWDARFLGVGVSLPANTWVRYEWETVAWVVTNAACDPEELS